MMISVFDRVENIVGKGENAGYQHFILFPQCFSKPSFSGLLKLYGIMLRLLLSCCWRSFTEFRDVKVEMETRYFARGFSCNALFVQA